jgi:hypothetical protein
MVAPDQSRFSLASVGLDDWRIERIEPVSGVVDLFATTAGARDVLLYVHGFNTTFETAVLDAARISDGIRFRGDTMVFSWPSKAKLLDYAYDRESATWPPHPHRGAQRRHHADPRGAAAGLCPERRHGDRSHRRRGLRLARHRHGCILVLGRAHRRHLVERDGGRRKLEALGLRVIDASAEGWGIINHDLFLSNAQIRQVIRRAIDGRA